MLRWDFIAMDSAIAILRQEHQRMLDIAAAAEALATRIEGRQEVQAEALQAVCDFFSLFAHRLHYDKEEALLFPQLRAKGIREGSCLGPLLAEHEEARAAFAALQQASADCANGVAGAAPRWAQAARLYCDRLRYHIRREEIVLANAEALLSASDQAELAKEFEDLDQRARRAGLAERIDAAEKAAKA